MVPPPSPNTIRICNHFNLLILYYISSRLVTLLKVINAPKQVSDISILLLVSSSTILAFRYSYFLFQKCLLASHLTLLRLYYTFLWFESCNHCILACFLWSKNCKHISSNHGLCHFTLHWPCLYLAMVFIFSSRFSQALFISLLSFRFSRAASLFEILVWYCLLTYSSPLEAVPPSATWGHATQWWRGPTYHEKSEVYLVKMGWEFGEVRQRRNTENFNVNKIKMALRTVCG